MSASAQRVERVRGHAAAPGLSIAKAVLSVVQVVRSATVFAHVST